MSSLFSSPVRFLITDGTATASNFSIKRRLILETVRLAVGAGIEMIQIREKQLPARMLFDLCVEAVALTSKSETKLLVNERFDIALAAGADGVHLTSTSIPVERVRANVPEGGLIGVSTHSFEEVLNAKSSGSDYAMLSPIFSTPGKGEPLGVGELEKICAAVSPFPVLAVGGVNEANVEAVLDAGGSGYAAIRYLNDFVRISA